MRSAPPIVPGTPDRNSQPAMPAAAARVLDGREAAAEPDHDAPDAAVAHQEVGADADHRDDDVARQRLEEIGEIGLVERPEHHLGGATDAEPRDAGKRCGRGQPAAHRRQALEQRHGPRGRHHAAPPAGVSP
jgi:hypothetical protein